MCQFKRKYLLRLNESAIPHAEFAKRGSMAVRAVEWLGERGYAERVDLDGAACDASDPEAHWQITEAGERYIGKAKLS